MSSSGQTMLHLTSLQSSYHLHPLIYVVVMKAADNLRVRITHTKSRTFMSQLKPYHLSTGLPLGTRRAPKQNTPTVREIEPNWKKTTLWRECRPHLNYGEIYNVLALSLPRRLPTPYML